MAVAHRRWEAEPTAWRHRLPRFAWRWPAVFTAAIGLLTLPPILLAALRVPSGSAFPGYVVIARDAYVYQSMWRAGWHGAWLFHPAYTGEMLPGIHGAARAVGAGTALLDDGGRPAAASWPRPTPYGERRVGGRRPAADLSAARAAGTCDHRRLGAAAPSAAGRHLCCSGGARAAALPRLPTLGLGDHPRCLARRAHVTGCRRPVWFPGALPPRRQRTDHRRPREPAVAR